MGIPYSDEKDDLYYPAKHAGFFPHGRPRSDAALCVEMARLAYCQLDTSFAFDQERIRKILGQILFIWPRVRSTERPTCRGPQCIGWSQQQPVRS